MKKLILNSFAICLPLGVAIIFIYSFTYLAIQQYIRLSANEILVQYAENTKEKLEKGVTISQAISGIELTDMQKSLSPFVIIYDKMGTVQASTTTLHGTAPTLSAGVFANALQNWENRRTWQPEHNVRNAIVVLPYALPGQEGYVVAGRSLREIEKRKQFLKIQIEIAIIVTLTATFLITLIVQASRNRSTQTPK